mmetsp:Transcript_98991/g.191237  ORF Transcript_98991/g.191237 Transcript_98991/m.191237 type:complete len:214 (-) Transcript_98991:308-949(-)
MHDKLVRNPRMKASRSYVHQVRRRNNPLPDWLSFFKQGFHSGFPQLRVDEEGSGDYVRWQGSDIHTFEFFLQPVMRVDLDAALDGGCVLRLGRQRIQLEARDTHQTWHLWRLNIQKMVKNPTSAQSLVAELIGELGLQVFHLTLPSCQFRLCGSTMLLGHLPRLRAHPTSWNNPGGEGGRACSCVVMHSSEMCLTSQLLLQQQPVAQAPMYTP